MKKIVYLVTGLVLMMMTSTLQAQTAKPVAGDVSDESAQAIGKQLGAQSIITGTFASMGANHRFRINVINVKTVTIEVQFSFTVQNDAQVVYLLTSKTAPAVQPAPATTPAPVDSGNQSRPGLYRTFPYTLSVASSVGFLYGQGEEIVYEDSISDIYYSQLLWDMKPLLYVGTALNFSRINPLERWGFFTDIALKFGIQGKTGLMEDRDWLADNGALTNFSSHENYTQGALILDFSTGLSFPLASRILISPYLGFSYMYFSWASQNGYIQYAEKDSFTGVYKPWNSSIPKTKHYGPAINYNQEWFLLSPGIALFMPFLRFFSGGLFFQCTPLILCAAQDEHFSRNAEFTDRVFGGILLEPKGKFTFSLHARIDFTLSVGYRYISGSRGTTYMRATGLSTSGKSRDIGTAGAEYAALDTGISVKIRF